MLKSGAEIRKEFIDFFVERGHSVVSSASLVPGGDQTLLFTNAGMVQFKDVFLGVEKPLHKRVVDSQKCMRVSGKHNDLDDVGRDDYHHTFFEMMGNWSFGDYYKKEAIEWAWELLTKVWKLDTSRLWCTCFKDEKGTIPTDTEAEQIWLKQPGVDSSHVQFFGRKDNFWEMADTGPCGPDSEIHYDRGLEFCDKQDMPGHVCRVNGDCKRFVELWNLVFIQYNRVNGEKLEPLPMKHVDTGMGFERVVSIIQRVTSNYTTDLFFPLIKETMKLSGQTEKQWLANSTPFRVIADHCRAACFLIADGVVPGNVGRNYICRMIIRRAARFGSKIGLNDPFLASVAEIVIKLYGEAYPELSKNKLSILDNITREEERFLRTLDMGISHLDEFLGKIPAGGILEGKLAFELYSTHGLPFEIARDIAREKGFEIDEEGFRAAMEDHRTTSSVWKESDITSVGDSEVYTEILKKLISEKKLNAKGVAYDPYSTMEVKGEVLAIIKDSKSNSSAKPGDKVEIVLPKSCFYIESGGQVSDTGQIEAKNWIISVKSTSRPTTGMIILSGEVVKGEPKVGDVCIAKIDVVRRSDIMRNHTATHLLHAELQKVLGLQARQAGSLVAPDRLRFDFSFPEAMTEEQIEQVEANVNERIMQDFSLVVVEKPLKQAVSEGAMALFGEKYGEVVRTIAIGEGTPFSYELCGGTHTSTTGDVGIFLITNESSAAAGIRRIEAVTGRKAYELVQNRMKLLKMSARILSASVDQISEKAEDLVDELSSTRKEVAKYKAEIAQKLVENQSNIVIMNNYPHLNLFIPDSDPKTLRNIIDDFFSKNTSGSAVVGTVSHGVPTLDVAFRGDLEKKGLNAVDILNMIADEIDGRGGGKPSFAQAGGKNPNGIHKALEKGKKIIEEKTK
jgi:alanyl-tRNA synthetase